MSALLAFFVNLAFVPYQPAQVTMFGQPSSFWDPFTRYDSGWYFQIARYGYPFVAGGPPVGLGKPGKIAYFPLYPLLMRYAGRLFGRADADVYLGGILVSWISFVLAMVALFFLARLDLPRRQAVRAVLLTAIFPFGFFFGMVYTEALFLLLAVSSFYAFRTRRWMVGGVCGGLATATRVTGILMLPALAWLAWRNAERTRRDRALAIVGLLLAVGGIGAYSIYVYQLSGNAFEWAASITRWGYHPGGPPWMVPVQFGQRLFSHPYRYLTTDRHAALRFRPANEITHAVPPRLLRVPPEGRLVPGVGAARGRVPHTGAVEFQRATVEFHRRDQGECRGIRPAAALSS